MLRDFNPQWLLLVLRKWTHYVPTIVSKWDCNYSCKTYFIYKYFILLFTLHSSAHRDINKSSEVKIVHTSVHGVGHTFVQAAFKAFDLRPPFAVEEQKDPDPEFPTVKYPNPEEGKGVLVQTHTHTYQHHYTQKKHLLWFFCRPVKEDLLRHRDLTQWFEVVFTLLQTTAL